MTAQQTFERMIREGIWPCLREHGFRRTRATFHRPAGPNWQVVNLQKSAWSDRAGLEFTINLGVALERLRGGDLDWKDGKRPAEHQCHLRDRLGVVMSGSDTWWDVNPRTDTRALAGALAAALEDFAFPWLDDRSSEAGVLALMSDLAGRQKILERLQLIHIAALARLAGQLGHDDLRRALAQEVELREAFLERRRQLEGS